MLFGRGEIQPWNEQQPEKEQSSITNTKMDMIDFGKIDKVLANISRVW